MASGSLHVRLGDAIKRRGSIRQFSTEMTAKNVRGATRSMIHRYLTPDGPPPPPDFLRAAAEILDVPMEWLRDGPPSDQVAVWKAMWTDEVRDGLAKGLPGLEDVGLAGHPLSRAVAVLTLWDDDTPPDHPMPLGHGELARRVARSVAGPAEAFGVDFIEMAEASPRAAEMYIGAVVMALNALAMYKGPFGSVGPDATGND